MKKYKIFAWLVLIVSILTILPMLALAFEAMMTEHFDESLLGAIIHGIKY